MRVANDRYSRELRSFNLAVRMLAHEARLLRTGDDRTKQSTRRDAILDLELVRGRGAAHLQRERPALRHRARP